MAAMMRQKRKQNLTISGAIVAIVTAIWISALPAAGASLVTTIVTDPLTGVALEGYDPVTYFISPEPQLGSSDFEAVWEGVPWYFVSAANRDVFLKNPEIYAPQYGGHCLMSLSRGYLSDGKPRLYAISGMKLYLFYSLANREAFFAAGDSQPIGVADVKWPELKAGLTGAEAPVMIDAATPPAAPAAH
jgi:YHS domain-containing protein